MLFSPYFLSFFFFFTDTAPTEIYTLSLHDALPIWASWETSCRTLSSSCACPPSCIFIRLQNGSEMEAGADGLDRKSTRLNSSHPSISYAVFCLKKKKKKHSTSQCK